MILSLISAVFVLLVAAFWAYQGLYSAAIMFIECVAAVMVAFGYYEALHGVWAAQMPEYGEGLALVLLFVVTLTVLRFSTDIYLPRNMHFPVAVDRAGGGLLGLLIGLQVIGVALVGVQMLPLGRTVLGFERFVNGDVRQRRSIWLNPDGFTVGLVELLSTGRFAGDGNGFEASAPDFLGDLYARNCGFQPECRRQVPASAVAVKNYWLVDQIATPDIQRGSDAKWARNYTPAGPEDPGHRYLVVRTLLDSNVTDAEADSSLRALRITPGVFRLVGGAADRSGVGQWLPACGMNDFFTTQPNEKFDPKLTGRLVKWPMHMRFALALDTAGALLTKDGKIPVDVVFEVPAEFTPWALYFKNGGAVALSKNQMLSKPPARASVAAAAPKKPAKPKDDEDEEAPAEPAKADEHPAKAEGDASSDSAGKADSDEEDEKESDEKPKADKPKEEESASGESAERSAPKKPVKVGDRGAGRLGLAGAIEDRTGVSSKLPRKLRRKDVPSTALAGGKFSNGQVVVDEPPADVPRGEAVSEFDVPEGLRMVQVGTEPILAGSLFGRAIEFAKRTISQIYVQTQSGKQYFALGVYTEAVIAGKRVFELQYWPEQREGEGVPERALREAKRLNAGVLRTAADEQSLKMGFLFLVPPGESIVSFHTSPRGQGQPLEITVE